MNVCGPFHSYSIGAYFTELELHFVLIWLLLTGFYFCVLLHFFICCEVVHFFICCEVVHFFICCEVVHTKEL